MRQRRARGRRSTTSVSAPCANATSSRRSGRSGAARVSLGSGHSFRCPGAPSRRKLTEFATMPAHAPAGTSRPTIPRQRRRCSSATSRPRATSSPRSSGSLSSSSMVSRRSGAGQARPRTHQSAPSCAPDRPQLREREPDIGRHVSTRMKIKRLSGIPICRRRISPDAAAQPWARRILSCATDENLLLFAGPAK